jgi:hypothetical protein
MQLGSQTKLKTYDRPAQLLAQHAVIATLVDRWGLAKERRFRLIWDRVKL